jgi:hypothetical protein
MKIKSNILLLSVILCINGCNIPDTSKRQNNQTAKVLSSENREIFKILKEKDSLLFELGFNQIDTLQVKVLTSDDFEFYHDEHGVMNSKKEFVKSISSIRELPFKTRRELVKGSVEIYPLYKNNRQDLYGAVQNGEHNFYQQKEGEEERKTSTAKFTHLWIIENNDWKLKRVLSFDHKIPGD